MAKKNRVRLWLEQLEHRTVPSLDLTGIEFRTIDGTNNNAALPTQGAAETRQIRFGYGAQFPELGFGDTIITETSTPRSRENPRTISNAIFDQGPTSVPNDRHLTDWAFQWGQWVTHDLDITRTGPEFGTANIPIEDPLDPLGPNPIPFNRSQFDVGTGVPGQRREVVNNITSYIDASNVYGSDPTRAAALRTGQGGKLKTSQGGQLLPLNDGPNPLPNADALGLGPALFLAGDVRANEQLNLTVVHTLFVREHNRLADRIHSLYPTLNDEQIFQVARRIVGAEQQVITYEEYLPAIFGFDLAPDPDDAVYDPNVNASVTNSFAHAAFRFGHSQINEATLLVNNANQTIDDLSVRDAFFNPQFLKDNPDRVGQMLKGLASQLGQENDLLLVDGIRDNLFGPPGAGGLDLGALDIQRGRDHGLPDFNTMRNAYRAGAPFTSFSQISSDPAIVAALQALYPTNPADPANTGVNNIDLFVGMLAEDHLPGAAIGPTLNAIVGNQFSRSRDGDRFFYTNDAFLNSAAVQAIMDVDDMTLANIIRLNTNVANLQDDVFYDKSVIVFEAPDAGSNVSLIAGLGVVSLIDNRTGEVHALRLLSNVKQVILVGSDAAPDFFNLFIAGAGGGLEDGVVAFGRGGTGDILNVFGRLFIHDTFTALDTTFSTGNVGVLPRPPENGFIQTVSGASVNVNGNLIFSSGFEKIRIVTLGGNDTVNNPDLLALLEVVNWHNPFDEN